MHYAPPKGRCHFNDESKVLSSLYREHENILGRYLKHHNAIV